MTRTACPCFFLSRGQGLQVLISLGDQRVGLTFPLMNKLFFFLSFFKKKLVNWLRHIQVKISKDLVGPSLLIPNCYDKHKILREAPMCSKSQFLVKSMKLDNAGE